MTARSPCSSTPGDDGRLAPACQGLRRPRGNVRTAIPGGRTRPSPRRKLPRRPWAQFARAAADTHKGNLLYRIRRGTETRDSSRPAGHALRSSSNSDLARHVSARSSHSYMYVDGSTSYKSVISGSSFIVPATTRRPSCTPARRSQSESAVGTAGSSDHEFERGSKQYTWQGLEARPLRGSSKF